MGIRYANFTPISNYYERKHAMLLKLNLML